MNNELFSNKSVRIGVVVLLVIASLFLAVKTVGAIGSWVQGDATETSPRISVQGTGEAFATPDTATFSFSVLETAKTVDAAQKQATDRMNKALEYLKGQGLPEKDIKTTDYNVYPQYSYVDGVCSPMSGCTPGKQTLTGYQVSQTIQVKVDDETKAGTLLAGIGSLGVQNISGLSFTIEDEDELMRQAREEAIKDAREKAEVLARDLGVRLGKIVEFQETNNNPMPYYAKATLESQAADGRGGVANVAPDLPGGENKITSMVTISFEIK